MLNSLPTRVVVQLLILLHARNHNTAEARNDRRNNYEQGAARHRAQRLDAELFGAARIGAALLADAGWEGNGVIEVLADLDILLARIEAGEPYGDARWVKRFDTFTRVALNSAVR